MSKPLYFVLGAVIGSATTWFITKIYYEKINQEDAESVRQMLAKERKPLEESDAPEEKQEHEAIKETYDNPRRDDLSANYNKPDIMEYTNKIKKEGYRNYSDVEMEDDEETEKSHDKYISAPYAIAPEHFGEDPDFETISLTLYSDGVLADELDEEMEDIDGSVGADFEEYFGKYDDEIVWIRNERLKIEYEISKDARTFEEVSGKKPRRVEIT